jgi:hypothetical protein
MGHNPGGGSPILHGETGQDAPAVLAEVPELYFADEADAVRHLEPTASRVVEVGGSVREGLTRSSSWALGELKVEVVLGLLADEWKPALEG